MTMSNARDVVDQYFSALKKKDFDTMRPLLHDDITFVGPLGTTDGVDEYIESLKRVTASMTGLERQALFAAGEDVCQIYHMTLAMPAATLRVAQWLKVREGRIAAVRLYFDARPFAPPPAS